ncbi:MmcQ/YjbR family DNA-binding protein [Arthrobacter sp. Soc17.1.1.1]|uniref:MmcQ/YjbR family DNA-binding protein n=1 Tax=Arthrobacter sp. Soc17.1.1.1 TaxID=3121277 RepID=UPI002FE4E7E9
MVSEDDVRSVCLALPGTSERLSWNRPAWFARTLFARMWDDTVLTVKTDERAALLATQPGVFLLHPHHERYGSLVLVRLGRLDRDQLGELIEDSYRIAGEVSARR